MGNRSTIPVVVALAAVVAVAGTAVAWQATTETQTCTVEDKDRTTNRNNGSDARLYTSCGVLAVADDPLRLHFASADVYAAVEPGQVYELTTVGWRLPLLSVFPNVLEASPAG